MCHYLFILNVFCLIRNDGDRIHYSDKYTDDEFEYRHVILPKPLLKLIPKSFFNSDDSGTLRILSETEWRGIGITQSLGWQHYEVHGRYSRSERGHRILIELWTRNIAPEPHVLLFRRPKDYGPTQPVNGRKDRKK